MNVAPALPPGGLFEIVFSFDTTGSMSQVIDEVKGRLQDMIQRLQADIPGIRIGVIAHGDYCDRDIFYFEKHLDLTTDVAQLCGLVQDVEGTGGGDPEECYEYVLNMTTGFDWTAGSQRALVLIGDATPHEPDYELNTANLDWRKEAETLANMGIKIYGVQAFENEDSTAFFEELVALTSGQHLKLGQFSHICDFIMAICYRERGEEFLEGYEAEVRAREARKGLHKDLEGLFGVLRRGDSSASAKSTGSLRKTASLSSVTMSVVPTVLSPVPSLVSNTSVTACTSHSVSVSSSTAVVLPVSVPAKKTIAKVSPLKFNAAKATKTVKTGKRTVKGITENKRNAVVAKLRHTVPESGFILNKKNLASRWSRWRLAMSETQPTPTEDWTQRSKYRSKCNVWKRRQLFDDHPVKANLYEFAVQTRKGGKKRIVFCKWSRMGAKTRDWESCLLGKIYLQESIEKLFGHKTTGQYRLFIRRFVPKQLGKNQKKAIKLFKNQYSYAWNLGMNIKRVGNRCYMSK